ncbi:carbohydrate-binding domain-containing protein [Corynebacterium mastitidis]|uniref:carbohydrate-binding domain-containing protein n=1 Tax=Corynebacterium mastitidis TaxID=161890 RepID=UPI0030EAF454
MKTHAYSRTIIAAALAASTLTVAACSGGSTAEVATAAETTTQDGTTIADTTQAPGAEAVRAGNTEAIALDEGQWSEEDTTDVALSGTHDVVLTEGGVYRLSGSLDAGVKVEAPEDATVILILDGVTIDNPDGPAIQIVSADKAAIWVNGTNEVSDASSYAEDAEANAAIYSDTDLTLGGTGSLAVEGRGADGIVSTDDLVILSGTIGVTAADDGLRGKDSLVVRGGDLTIDAQGGDALRSNQTDDTTKGWVEVSGGTLSLRAADDGIDAATDVLLTGGDVTIDSEDKGVVAGTFLSVEGARATITAQDDGLHSDGSVGLHSGDLIVSAGDDGVHAEVALVADGANLTVEKSEEALEGGLITLAAGTIDVTAADDGINASGYTDAAEALAAQEAEEDADSTDTSDSSESPGTPGAPGAPGATPGQGIPPEPRGGDAMGRGGMTQGSMPPGGPGGGMDESSGEQLTITGGTVTVDAGGDGLDSNGDVVMSGGEVTVWGPTGGGNGSLDYNGEFTITGGTLAAIGSAGMAEAPSSAEGQSWVQAAASGGAGEEIVIADSQGSVIATYTAEKDFGNVVFSSPEITSGDVYTVTVGGTAIEATAGESTGATMGGPGARPAGLPAGGRSDHSDHSGLGA